MTELDKTLLEKTIEIQELNIDEAIADADHLLYQAKEKGRNVVVTN